MITLIMAIFFVSVFYLNNIPEIAYRVMIFGLLCILLLALFWFFLLNNAERSRMEDVLTEFKIKFKTFLANKKFT